MNREQAVEIIERHIDNNIASGSLVEQALSMAIDALKAQLSQEGTTSDLISRWAAIDAVRASYDEILDFKSTGRTVADSVEDIISELPSVQPEPQWIPVGERLPETGGESFFDGMVLITLRDKETGDLYVLNDKYCGDGDWLMCVPDEPTEVIAWMPLPEAYKPNK